MYNVNPFTAITAIWCFEVTTHAAIYAAPLDKHPCTSQHSMRLF